MDTSTHTASGGSAADAGATMATISTPNPETEARLRALVAERGPALRIRLHSPADFDVSGHQMSATSLTLDLLDEDDVEGHTINLHFPKLEDARQFEQRMIATGAIVGTLVVAGTGLSLSQALPSAPSDVSSTQAQVQSISSGHAPADPIYPNAVSPSTGGTLTGKEEALLTELSGAEGADVSGGEVGISPTTGGPMTGKEQQLLNELTGPSGAEVSGGDVGISPTTGGALTGKEKDLLTVIIGPDPSPGE